MVDVEQWAEVRRLAGVEGLSIREISRRTGLHRKTVRRALAAVQPPQYSRLETGSKLDPFKDWICEQLSEDATVPSQRLRELATEIGYAGGRSISDDYVREVRPLQPGPPDPVGGAGGSAPCGEVAPGIGHDRWADRLGCRPAGDPGRWRLWR